MPNPDLNTGLYRELGKTDSLFLRATLLQHPSVTILIVVYVNNAP